MKELGEYLQDTRRSNGVSLEEAANDLEVDVSYLENKILSIRENQSLSVIINRKSRH